MSMSKVFFSVSVSLDGYLAPPGMDIEHASDPTYDDWGAQWGKLQSWILPTRFFRKNLKLSEDGETGIDNQIVEHTFRRTGVSIMGRRMFDLGERMWPEEAPFHTPVFVLTSQVRESILFAISNSGDRPRDVIIEEELRPARTRAVLRPFPRKPTVRDGVLRLRLRAVPGAAAHAGYVLDYQF